MKNMARGLVCGLGALLISATTTSALCVGDCDESGDVSVDEIIKNVNISLGTGGIATCSAGDADADGTIDVTEIIQGVNNALGQSPCFMVGGSPASPTATTGTAPATATPSGAPTPSLTPMSISSGPVITFFGLATADGHPAVRTGTTSEGYPIYASVAGAGFIIVIESKPGTDGQPAGTQFFNSDPANPAARPDLQILSNHKLGNGSAAVCDVGPLPDLPLGGVPGVDPPSFDPSSQTVADVLNDFGCRFADNSFGPCTLDAGDNYDFVNAASTKQFCTATVLGTELHFPSGDTLLTVQLRDITGVLGSPAHLVVHVP